MKMKMRMMMVMMDEDEDEEEEEEEDEQRQQHRSRDAAGSRGGRRGGVCRWTEPPPAPHRPRPRRPQTPNRDPPPTDPGCPHSACSTPPAPLQIHPLSASACTDAACKHPRDTNTPPQGSVRPPLRVLEPPAPPDHDEGQTNPASVPPFVSCPRSDVEEFLQDSANTGLRLQSPRRDARSGAEAPQQNHPLPPPPAPSQSTRDAEDPSETNTSQRCSGEQEHQPAGFLLPAACRPSPFHYFLKQGEKTEDKCGIHACVAAKKSSGRGAPDAPQQGRKWGTKLVVPGDRVLHKAQGSGLAPPVNVTAA